MRRVLAALGLCAAAGCADQMVPLGDNVVVGALVPPIEREQIDVLFVADTSGSMRTRRDEVAARVSSALADVIGAAMGGPPDLHIGVITSNMGTLSVDIGQTGCVDSDGGRLHRPAACTQTTDLYLADAGGGATVNYTGALADALACLVQIETNGCGFEQPFAAVAAALQAPDNLGFLRPDAQLVVVFLTDEDDCSAVDPAFFEPESPALGPLDSYRCFHESVACVEGVDATGIKTGCVARDDNPLMLPLEGFAEALIAAKSGDATKVMVAAFTGPSEPIEIGLYTPMGAEEPRLDVIPSCQYTDLTDTTKSADPAPRLDWLLDRFAGLSWGESICQPVDETLPRAANAIGDAAGRRACLRGTFRDADAATPGLQPECRAYLVTDVLTAAAVRTDVPACDGDAGAGCFAIVDDAATCGQWLGLEVELRGLTPSRRQALLVECVIPDPPQ